MKKHKLHQDSHIGLESAFSSLPSTLRPLDDSDRRLGPRQAAKFVFGDEDKHPTLANWRYRGIGPRYLKLGRKSVVYLQSDLEKFMTESAREPREREAG